MKIIEALKNLKTIEKRIEKNNAQLKQNVDTYKALNPSMAIQRLNTVFNGKAVIDTTNPPKVMLAFKETERNYAIQDVENMVESIDAALEVANATIDLQGY